MPHTDTHLLPAPVWGQIERGLCKVKEKRRKRVDKVKKMKKKNGKEK